MGADSESMNMRNDSPTNASACLKLGFVPNIIRSFALVPDHFVGWWRYFDDLMQGSGSGLPKSQREMVAVAVSAENRCHY